MCFVLLHIGSWMEQSVPGSILPAEHNSRISLRESYSVCVCTLARYIAGHLLWAFPTDATG